MLAWSQEQGAVWSMADAMKQDAGALQKFSEAQGAGSWRTALRRHSYIDLRSHGAGAHASAIPAVTNGLVNLLRHCHGKRKSQRYQQ